MQLSLVVKGTADEKIKTLNDCGVETADTPSEIGTTLIEAAKKLESMMNY